MQCSCRIAMDETIVLVYHVSYLCLGRWYSLRARSIPHVHHGFHALPECRARFVRPALFPQCYGGWIVNQIAESATLSINGRVKIRADSK